MYGHVSIWSWVSYGCRWAMFEFCTHTVVFLVLPRASANCALHSGAVSGSGDECLCAESQCGQLASSICICASLSQDVAPGRSTAWLLAMGHELFEQL
jgi:hypothetical protein